MNQRFQEEYTYISYDILEMKVLIEMQRSVHVCVVPRAFVLWENNENELTIEKMVKAIIKL